MRLDVLAAVLANLQQFEALFEDEGTDTLTAPDGERISLHDVRHLYARRFLLPLEEAVTLQVSLYDGANGYEPGHPHIIAIVRRLCELTGTEYEEPPLPSFLESLRGGSGGSLTFLGG